MILRRHDEGRGKPRQRHHGGETTGAMCRRRADAANLPPVEMRPPSPPDPLRAPSRKTLLVAAMMVFASLIPFNASAQRVPCPEPDDGPVCVNTHPRELAKIRALLEYQRRGIVLLTAWRSTSKASETLMRRLRNWRTESARYTAMVDNDWPPPGVTYVQYGDSGDSERILQEE